MDARPASTFVGADGKPVAFDNTTDAEAALRAGKVGYAPGGRTPIVAPDGKPANVANEELQQALKAGYRLATEGDIAKVKAEAPAGNAWEKLKEIGGAAAAILPTPGLPIPFGLVQTLDTASSALTGKPVTPLPQSALAAAAVGGQAGKTYLQEYSSGLTMGLDNVAIKKGLDVAIGDGAGKAYAEGIAARQQQNREAALQGMIAGNVAGGVLGSALAPAAATANAGRIGALARAAMAPQIAVAKVGLAAERAVGGIVGSATNNVAVRALQGAARLGVQGGVENALTVGTRELTDQIISEDPISVDKIALASSSAFWDGFKPGAAFGAAIPLGARALTYMQRGVNASKAAAATSLHRLADEANLRDLHPRKELTRGLDFKGVTTREAGDWLERNIYTNADGTRMPAMERARLSQSDKYAKVQAAVERVGQKLEDARSPFADIHVPLEKYLKPVEDAADEFAKYASPAHQAAAANFRNFSETIRRNAGARLTDAAGNVIDKGGVTISIGEMVRQRIAVDSMIQPMLQYDSPLKNMNTRFRALRGTLEDTIMESIDEAAKARPPGLRPANDALPVDVTGKAANDGFQSDAARRIAELKKEYKIARWAEEAARDNVVRAESNNMLSLGDKVAGGVGFGLGGFTPLGVAAGVGLAWGRKLMRERGMAATAAVMHDIADAGDAYRKLRAVETAITRASEGVVAGPLAKPMARAWSEGKNEQNKQSLKEQFKAAREMVVAATADPIRTVENAAAFAPVPGKPEVNAQAQQALMRGVTYMQNQIPQASPGVFGRDDKLPPVAKQFEFVRKWNAVTNPMGKLEEMANGDIDTQFVRMLEEVHPAIYQELKAGVIQKLSERKGPVDPIQARKLALGFDIYVDPTMRPQAIAVQHLAAKGALAGESSTGGKAGSSQGPGRPRRKLDMGSLTQPTLVDHIESRGARR